MILDHLATSSGAYSMISEALRADSTLADELKMYVSTCLDQVRSLPKPLQLERGIATIPLKGIDVPFHSSHLRAGVHSYRKFLQKRIHASNIQPEKLVGKFVPNVMAERFSLDREYIQEAYRLTQSSVLRELLDEGYGTE